jgi:hypothetical protein
MKQIRCLTPLRRRGHPIPMRTRLAGLAAGFALLGAAAPAAAELVTFSFTGFVATLTGDAGLFGPPGEVPIEQPFSGSFSYEVGAGNPDQSPGDPEVGRYGLADLVVDQAAIPLATLEGVSVVHQPGGPTLPPADPDPGRDWLFANATAAGYTAVRLRLQGPYESAFSDDSLPTALDLADFPDVAVVHGIVSAGLPPNPAVEDVGVITALWRVPEPGRAALGAIAIAALAGRVRAKCGRVPVGTRWATPLRSDD